MNGRPRVKGKGLGKPCLVCGEMRIIDNAHFPRRKRPGHEGIESVPLCPTHHKLLDQGRLNKLEFKSIMKAYDQFDKVEDFVTWAYDNGYPYALDDLRKKFWDY